MHPAAIKYGLENDMIQFRGEKVVFSDEFLERISAAARDELGGKRINGSELLDGLVGRGVGETPIGYCGYRGEANSLYANLNVLLFETMFPYAERAGIGYRIGRTFYFARQFASDSAGAGDSPANGRSRAGLCKGGVPGLSRCRRGPMRTRHPPRIAVTSTFLHFAYTRPTNR